MEKKIILLLFLLMPLVFAYEVNVDEVYLNEFLKADANFVNSNVDANALCNLFIIDDQNFVVDRLTDEYLTDDNHLYSVDYQIEEPPLFRGDTYTLKAICLGVEKTSTFTVLNKRGIGLTTEKEIEFLTKQSNIDTIFILLAVIFVIVIFVAIIYFIALRGKNG
jgi:hypothetical protein